MLTNLSNIQQQILACEQQYGREPNSVQLLAVSKKKPLELILQAVELGQYHFGESYVQEALVKIQAVPVTVPITWHYIGRLQSNKLKAIAENFAWVQTVTSLAAAEKLQYYRPDQLVPLNICLQINITQESQKAGILIEEFEQIRALIKPIIQLPKLRLRGLMAMGYADNHAANVLAYNNLYKQFQALKAELKLPYFDTLSLGMSQDMALAIAQGSTMVRIGQAIFGEREKQ